MLRRSVSYHLPRSLEEALARLAEAPAETDVLGGGTWVVPELQRAQRRPRAVLDLRLAGLGGVVAGDGRLRVGATTTYRELERSPHVRAQLPVLAELAHGITGGAQIRNQGTVGGSACYASPSSDVPGALVGLGAAMAIAGPRGARTLPAADFLLDARRTALAPDELLTAIELPLPAAGVRSGYVKLKLCESSWPIVTALATLDGARASIALGGLAARPLAIACAWEGAPSPALDAALEQALATAVEAAGGAWDDALAPADYRRRIAPVAARRALLAAAEAAPCG